MMSENKEQKQSVTEQAKKNGVLNKHDLRRAAVRYSFMGVNVFNYETQQGPSLVWSLAPALRKIYKNDDEGYKKSLDNQFKYFNTTTAMSNIIMGAGLAMEEKDGTASLDAVQSLKTSLMGPFAGIGDTIVWILYPTIMGSIAAYMDLQGNMTGGLLWLALNFVFLWLKYKMFDLGYFSGVKLVSALGDRMSVFTDAASVMGLSVVGALIATVVKIYIPISFKTGKVTLALQSGVIDKIMPALLPALAAWGIYVLLGKKGWTANRVILLVIAVALLGAFTGILGVQPA